MSIDNFYTLGRSGLRVSRFALGTMTFGTEWGWVAELEQVAQELDRSMAQVAVNWTAHRPGIASVIVGATKLSQLQDNLKALEFEIPIELVNRLEAVSRPEAQFPYSFFGNEIQGMIHGGVVVGSKPAGYAPDRVKTEPRNGST